MSAGKVKTKRKEKVSAENKRDGGEKRERRRREDETHKAAHLLSTRSSST